MYYYVPGIKLSFFPGIQRFSLAAAGLFWRSRPRGTQGTRLYTVQVWVLAGLHGACSGRSKLRNLANNHGIAFRPAINGANRAHANPQNVLFIFHLSAAVFEVPQQPSKARQPRYNSRASSFSRCDSHERCFLCARVCVCVILGAYSSSRNQEQSVSRREVQFQLLFFCFFFFCCNISCLLLCTCVGIFTGTRCL